MSGLKRNFIELRDSIEPFVDTPFSFIPLEKQTLIIRNLTTIFSVLLTSLEKEGLEKTVFYSHVQALGLAVKNEVNEQKFAQHLKPFLDALTKNDRSYSHEALYPVVKKFLDRVLPFVASEEQARKYRDAHTVNEIHTHDVEIIKKSMQIYALDYFLFMQKNLRLSRNPKIVILSGVEKAPALSLDALDDDILKKVVYSLYGKNIRKRMIDEYYTYKKVFLPVFDENTLTDQKISEIINALSTYCLSLIDISLEYDVTTLKNSLLEAYGPNADLIEVKKQISHVIQ